MLVSKRSTKTSEKTTGGKRLKVCRSYIKFQMGNLKLNLVKVVSIDSLLNLINKKPGPLLFCKVRLDLTFLSDQFNMLRYKVPK